jgi:acyl-CoA thioester hydrolase
MAMLEVLRSGVNLWDCDQMGHMNVRHYFGRVREGLEVLALELGLPPQTLRAAGQRLRVREQHVRFLGEMRAGTPYTVWAGVLDATPGWLRVYFEIRFVGEARFAAASVVEVELVRAADGTRLDWPAAALARATELGTELPEHGQVRGVNGGAPRPAPAYTEAVSRGMVGAFLGPVRAEDCDDDGLMAESAYMARIADGIPHFFFRIRQQGIRPSGIGGAALEYRFVYHQRPRPGDVIEVRSALIGLGKKTFQLCHWIFDRASGSCVATSEAVVVSFDLTTRKSIEIPDDTRAQMQAHVIDGLGI